MRLEMCSATLGLVLLASPVARAQDSSRVDLSGEWRGSVGTASFDGRACARGGDSYHVVAIVNGHMAEGSAVFDGQRLSVSTPELAGFVAKLTEKAPSGTREVGFDYLRDSGRDVFVSPRGDLSRTRPITATEATGRWVGRSQIEATLAQVEGHTTPHGFWSFLTRNPLVAKVANFVKPGLSTKDEKKKLEDYMDARERAWGQAVTDLPSGSVPDYDLFRAQKAAALDRFGRTPADVTEGFIDARGSVDGNAIAPRRVFWQRWKPLGKPSGRLVVISPGFQETGRNFYEQIQLLNREGDDVIVMDHQWAGYTQGSPGGLDRGFGVARDVAAVAAFAHEVAPNEKLVLFGNSMGAGPGVLGAATLNDSGKIQLDGAPMPRSVPIVLQAPFIKMTPSFLNETFAVVSHIPGVNRLELPALGLPILSHDKDSNGKFANHASAEDVRAQSRTMTAANADIARVMDLVKSGNGPTGRVYVVHETHDPLADPSGSEELVKALGSRARLDLVNGNDHVIEENAATQGRFLAGIRWVTVR